MSKQKIQLSDHFDYSRLLRFVLPCIGTMLFTSIYGIVDGLCVSNFVGKTAFAAVNLIMPFLMILGAVGFMLGTGGSALVAYMLGVGNERKANETFSLLMYVLITLGAIFTVLGLLFLESVARLLGADETLLPYCVSYGRVILIALIPFMLQNAFQSFLVTAERPHFGLYITIAAGVTNIVLDPVFIFALGMGVRGAVLATVISQCLSCMWVLVFLRGKKTTLTLRAENFFPGAKLVLPCIALGAASFVMMASESVISVCFNSSLLKYGGDIAVGAMTILTSVMQLAMLPLQGIAQGAQPILSYNYGARSAGRVRGTFRLLLRVSLCFSVTLWALVMLFPGLFAGMFSSDAALILFTKKALRIYCGALFMFGIQIACQMTFVSIGFAGCSIIVAVMRKFVLLLPLIYIMPQFIADKTTGVYTAEPVADIIAVCFTAVMFSVEFKKAMKALEDKGAEPA